MGSGNQSEPVIEASDLSKYYGPFVAVEQVSFSIPRGQVVLAGGTAKPDDKRITVEARRGDTRFGICSTTFLEQAFRTDYYRIDIDFHDDGSWTYLTRTDLAVRGKEPAFNHHDTNTMRRVKAPEPNPMLEAEGALRIGDLKK